jgi:hypothetical protein
MLSVIRWKGSPEPKSFTLFRQKLWILFTESGLFQANDLLIQSSLRVVGFSQMPFKSRPNCWRSHAPRIFFDDRTMILVVDAVAFRPNIAITEEGDVRGLKNLKRLDDPDLLTEFLKDPPDFAQFLQSHWMETYSSLFVFHLQPVNPAFPCSIIHV